MEFLKIKWKTEAQVICLSPFTVYSLCKWKFVMYPFVDEETKRSSLFADQLNRLAHLCFLLMVVKTGSTWVLIYALKSS
jgi:hypothetical protein